MLFTKVKNMLKNPEGRRLLGLLILLAGAILQIFRLSEVKCFGLILVIVGILLLAIARR